MTKETNSAPENIAWHHYERTIKTQSEWDDLLTQFNNKIVLYSSWILATSVTWFIALYEKSDITKSLQTQFWAIIIFSLIAIFFGLVSLYFSSYCLFCESKIHKAEWKINQSKNIEEKKELYKKQDWFLKKNKWFARDSKVSLYIYLWAFLFNCFTIVWLFFSIK